MGGALRDLLLGRRPKDLDFLAKDPLGAAEEAQARLGGRVFPLDPERGQYRLAAGGLTLDFAPWTGDLEADLVRRDYRVNALVLRQGVVFGPRGAAEDLKGRLLVLVREENLYQDHLRSLRGVRLAAELGLGLPPRTRRALARHARFLEAHPENLPAPERVREEVERILLSPRAAWGFWALERLGLLRVYFPELTPLVGLHQGPPHRLEAWAHTLSVLHHLLWLWPEAPLPVRLAALYHDCGKPLTRRFDPGAGRYRFLGHAPVGAEVARAALAALRFPKAIQEEVQALVQAHMDRPPAEEKALRRFYFRRKALLPGLPYLMAADRLATGGPPEEAYALLWAYRKALAEPLPARPLLSGEEVMALLGLSPGPRVGQALRALLLAQAEGRVRTREEAQALLLGLYSGNAAQAPSPRDP